MALPSAPKLSATIVGAPYSKMYKTVVYIVPTIANTAAPTSVELTAGKDVTDQIISIDGFTTDQNWLDLNVLGAGFTGQLPGRKTAAAAAITFQATDKGATDDARQLFTEGSSTHVVFFNEGVITGGTLDVWSARVGSISTPQDTEAIGSITVNFGVYKDANKSIVIPTA